MSLSDIKFAQLPVVRLQYIGGHPSTENLEWGLGNYRILTRNDSGNTEFFDEVKSALKKEIPVKAIWCMTNVPSQDLNAQVSAIIYDQGALVFEMHVLEDPRFLTRKRWDEIIDLMEKSFKQSLQKRTVH